MFETMRSLIEGFPGDLERGVNLVQSFGVQPAREFRNVMISGLGGSGIGGTIVSEIVESEAAVPVSVNNNYTLPAWVNAHTLFVACSYSGNTEETLAATEEALKRGCTVVCISSGGALIELANSLQLAHIQIPSGYPPRTALSFSLCALLRVLYACGITKSDFSGQLKSGAAHIKNLEAGLMKQAEAMAAAYANRIPAIYAAQGYGGVAVRWRQQINENGKMLCWHHVLPEMNHNELVGWAGGDNRVGVIMFRTADDHPRTALRMELSKEIFKSRTDLITEITAIGNNRIERVLHLIYLGDWLSYFLSIERQVDPVEVNVITHLKNELSKH